MRSTSPTSSGLGPAPFASALRVAVAFGAAALIATACGSGAGVQPVVQPGIAVATQPSEAAPGATSAPSAAGAADPAEAAPAPVVADEPATEVAPVAAAQDAVESAQDAADDSDAAAAEAATASASVDERPVIASAQGTDKFPELWIHSFRREGAVLRLDFTVRVQSPSPGESYYIRRTFSSIEDSEITGDAANSLRAASFSGITLVDSVNGNRHLVLRDTQGDCLCTTFPNYFIDGDFPENFVTPGAALFPAPPQGVTSMTVLFPVFGSFELEIENA